jgi:hypothetical protein
MIEKFTIPELVIISLVASLIFTIFLIFEPLLTSMGIPPFPILIPVAMMWMVCYLIVNKLGTFTIGYLLFSLMATPTIIWGPFPGPYKIVIALIAGVIIDMIMHFSKRLSPKMKGMIYGLNGLIMTPLMTVTMFLLFKTELSEKLLDGMIVIMSITGLIIEGVGGFLGAVMYLKIQDKKVIKMIKAWKL